MLLIYLLYSFQTVARVQVLVLCDEGDCDRLFLHLLWVLQHTCLLANPSHVLHHTFLHHHEKTNKGEQSQIQHHSVQSTYFSSSTYVRVQLRAGKWGHPNWSRSKIEFAKTQTETQGENKLTFTMHVAKSLETIFKRSIIDIGTKFN